MCEWMDDSVYFDVVGMSVCVYILCPQRVQALTLSDEAFSLEQRRSLSKKREFNSARPIANRVIWRTLVFTVLFT